MAATAALTVLATAGHAQSQALPLKRAPRPTRAAIRAEDLMTRLYIIADDSMVGRRLGDAGNVKATTYIASELQRLGLEPAGDSGTYFQTLPDDTTAQNRPRYPSRNVVAIVRGTDPTLSQTYVAVGAHTDHLGLRRQAVDHDSVRARYLMAVRTMRAAAATADTTQRDSIYRAAWTWTVNVDSLRRLRPARRDSIYNGADDDGSGTVALLEVAEALAGLPAKPKRSILFVFHTGEEAGQLGSKYFVAHPTVPLDSIVTQVNLDMIGRGSAEDLIPGEGGVGGPDLLLVVGASRLSSELGRLVEAVNAAQRHPLRLDYSWDAPNHPEGVYTRSDHYSYAQRGIPSAFFFTGLHPDYHQVTDEPQYIDYPHLTRITRYVYDLVLRLGSLPQRPVVDRRP